MIKPRFAFLLTLAAAFSSPVDGGAADLEPYRWQNRLLLLFDTGEKASGYAAVSKQVALRRGEVADRDLVVFHVLEAGPSRVGDRALSVEEALRLRSRFEVRPGVFTAVLVGKDGGVKLVRHHSVDLQEVFDRIDAMPMRQREMREKSSGSS